MRDSFYFDRAGRPISQDEWMRLWSTDYKIVKQSKIDTAEVSTVWLGMDHSFGYGPLMIFETMIFERGPLNNDCWRYTTETQALAGHDQVCALVTEALAARAEGS